MTKWKIPLYKIYTDNEDVNLITKIVKRGTSWAIGPEIEEFENQLKNYVSSEYCVALNSGTSSLHAVLLAYELDRADEVIVPSFSFVSTANSVLFVGANPIFSDIEEDTFGLDPKVIQNQISSKTKVIMPMDYGGMACKIFDIQSIAQENNSLLIEDASESLGTTVQNKKIGSIADSTIFSFCGNKVLTTGEGGAVVTNDKKIFEKLKLIRSHGRLDANDYFDTPNSTNYVSLGYNWRMSSLTAALGITQLQKLDKIIKMRKENARYLSEKLGKFSAISVPKPPSGHDHIYQMYTIRLLNNNIRNKLHEFLTHKEIFSKIYFPPIHLTSFYKNLLKKPISLPITEKVSDQVLTLPLYPNMTIEEKEYLTSSIAEFFEEFEFDF